MGRTQAAHTLPTPGETWTRLQRILAVAHGLHARKRSGCEAVAVGMGAGWAGGLGAPSTRPMGSVGSASERMSVRIVCAPSRHAEAVRTHSYAGGSGGRETEPGAPSGAKRCVLVLPRARLILLRPHRNYKVDLVGLFTLGGGQTVAWSLVARGSGLWIME